MGLEIFHPHETQVHGLSSKTENWRRQWKHTFLSLKKMNAGSRNPDCKHWDMVRYS